MSKLILPLNASHVITVDNGSKRSFTFGSDGTLIVPGNVYIGNSSNAYRAIINGGNIATADKTFSFPNRNGNIALEDSTSLTAMLPNQATHNGHFLQTDGAGNLSWQATAASGLTSLNGISTSTYQSQTFATPGTSGTAPAWTSVNSNTNTHTLNIPMASAASVTAGLLSNADYGNIPFKNNTNTFSAVQTFTNAPSITNPGTGTNDVATYGQVLAARNGVGIRPPVDLLDTVTTASSLNGVATVDGVTVTVGMRVLATALTGGNGNKVYKCASTGPTTWTLELDGQAGTGAPTDGDLIFVRQGVTAPYADQQWAYNGTAWVLYNTSAAYTFSTGLSVSGNTISVAYGTSGSTACVGNDSRLSDARTPTAHVLDSATHTISGKTAGQVLLATAATTYAFTTISQDLTLDGSGIATIGYINNVAINTLAVKLNTATLTDNTVSNTLVTGGSWAIASYRSIKIHYSIGRGANYVTGYIVLIHDGSNPQITVVEDDSIGTHGITFATDINSGNIRLLYQTTSSGSNASMTYLVRAIPV